MYRNRLTRQESREQTRKRLLDAAATVIASKGLASTTVEETTRITSPDLRAAVDALYTMCKLNRVLRNVHSELESITHRVAGSDDLTLMHWCVLVRLLEQTTCKQIDLKSHIGISPPHLTKLLDQLITRSFVRRDRCAQDRRQFILTLTQAGRDTCLNFLGSLNENEHQHPFIAMTDLLDLFISHRLVHCVTP